MQDIKTLITQKERINYDDIVEVENGVYIFNPYNPLNVEIKKEDIMMILDKYGVPPVITNLNLYKRAFVHKSYIKRPDFENVKQNIQIVDKPEDCISLKTKSNESLEFLGDGVLELITKFYLYKRFPNSNEGFMTEKKIAIVKNETIGRIAYEMGLHKWFLISKNAEEKMTRTNVKKLGCLFESFIGALFLDFNKVAINDEYNWFSSLFLNNAGFQMAQVFLENIFSKHIDWTELINSDDNYKNILQVKIQKEFKVTPHYIELNIDEAGYTMGVYLCIDRDIHKCDTEKDAIHIEELKNFKGIREYLEANKSVLVFLGKASHKIKRKAEQLACQNILAYLQD